MQTKIIYLKVYINKFFNRGTNKLVVKFHKVLIFSRNALTIFHIFYAMSNTNRQNKCLMLYFLKQI